MRGTMALTTALGAVALGGCELPAGRDVTQKGWRGVALENIANTRIEAKLKAENALPPDIPAVAGSGKAGPWQNVQYLGGLDSAEMTRTMSAMAAWVAQKGVKPTEAGCLYCHNPANYASDEKYTKVVARKMLGMTQHVNASYTNHVQQTGVTCYTCHRGMPVPANIWFFTDRYQPLRHYLDREDFRVQGAAALPADSKNRSSIYQTEYAYALMINMSNALGVNCTFCHNSRIWSDWSQSSPQRMTALRGIRMVRDLNQNYLVPLQGAWPANRLGPHGDGPKLQCSTCHNGVNKPLYGAAMAKGYPGLYPGARAVDTTKVALGGSSGDAPAAVPGGSP
ncbi:MAG: photosynthetic reaction center cytochrome PufC [Gemmatimonadales bacterium]|nr:photosynthetic reaction center cytochrome PufC [Gemmatimonadales bacterium]